MTDLTTSTSVDVTTSSNVTMSNLTEGERMQYLEHLDAEKWPYIYPVIIYLLILMVIGIFGNSVVIAVYYKKFKSSTTRVFILTLATFDLLTCTLSVPGVIVELRYHYTFFFPGLCKLFRASRMFFVLMSLFTLIVVAVDRFRKVCRPLKPQYTIKSALVALLVVNIVALCLTVFGAVVGGNRTVKTDRDDIFGSNCSYDDEFIGKPITKVYSGLLFLLFIVCVTLLVVLYSLIGRQIYRHRNFRFKSGSPNASSSGSKNQTSSTEMQQVSEPIKNSYHVAQSDASSGYSTDAENVKNLDISYSRGQETPEMPKKQKPKTKKDKQVKTADKKRTSGKTTFTFFIITVVFILSFLPFLILVALWGSDWTFVNGLHGYIFTVFKMFFHSYHINNVVNAYIYGFCNPRFRNECRALFSCLSFKK